MKYDKFTVKMQEAVVSCQDLAEKSEHQVIEVEHFVHVLINQKESFVPELLKNLSFSKSIIEDIGVKVIQEVIKDITPNDIIASLTQPNKAHLKKVYKYYDD